MADDMQKLIGKLAQRSSNKKLIESAFDFAREAYKEKFRISGENYIFHALRVALYLDKMNLDPTTISLALLHDVIDDVPGFARAVEMRDIEKKFGKDLAKLLEKISKLSKIRYSISVGVKEKKTFTIEKIENLRKMFLAISGDLRVILVELVSKLDGLNLLHYLPEDMRKVQALETLQIFVPIASRLGLSEIRRNLEDVAFSHLFPDRFNWLKENSKEQYEEEEKYLKRFIPVINKMLIREKVKILDINYRVKSYWSTYQKLARHNMDFNEVHDLLALRIITSDVESCYKILGLIHKNFRPITEEIKDYIAKPKANGYRSLHTTVYSNEGKITEIQIRTLQMQKESEYGVCAHWAYKEKLDLTKSKSASDWPRDISGFWKTFKIDFFTSKIFCFTPKGDVVVMPKGSCPVDFAYAVHSAIGNHCELARVNGKIVSLSHTLENADVVEIVVNKNKHPSADWLRFVKTPFAKSHIKKLTERNNKSIFGIPIPSFIKRKIIEISEASRIKKEEKEKLQKEKVRHVYIAGQKGMLMHIAKCCNPHPGDKVKAYIAPHRAVVLHRIGCSNFKKIAEKFPEKIIDASWE